MKKHLTLSVILFLFCSSCFTQVITKEYKPYIHPIKDSIKVYQTEYATLLIRYVLKNDSIEYRKNTYSITNPSKLMAVIGIWKESCWCTAEGYVYMDEVILSPATTKTISKKEVINLLQEDSIDYRPDNYYTFENRISYFEEKNSISTDIKTMADIFSKFYKVSNPYVKIDNLLKNNIPLYLSKVEIISNIIGNPEVTITITNISKNDIDAYDIEIYCYNRYGEPVKKYTSGSNISIGTSQDIIYSGAESNDTWTLYGQELTTNVKVFLSKVHFANGKTLVIQNKQLTKIEGKLE